MCSFYTRGSASCTGSDYYAHLGTGPDGTGGSRLSVGTIALPPLLLVLGITYSLHVMTEYYEQAHPGRTVEGVLLETLHSINLPVLMAALTTVVGFLSLFVNRIVGIREMGIYAAAGITIAFLLALVFVPAGLALLPLPTRSQVDYAPALSAGLRKLTRAVIRHRRAVITGSLIVTLLCLLPIPAIQVGSNFLSFFRKSHPASIANEAVNNALGGGMAFYVVIDGNAPDLMRKEDTLRRIKDLQLYINAQPGVAKTLSFVDYCEALDQGIQALPNEDGSSPNADSHGNCEFLGKPHPTQRSLANDLLELIQCREFYQSPDVFTVEHFSTHLLVTAERDCRTSQQHPGVCQRTLPFGDSSSPDGESDSQYAHRSRSHLRAGTESHAHRGRHFRPHVGDVPFLPGGDHRHDSEHLPDPCSSSACWGYRGRC